ncbi:MAG TPA: peptidylprolyl isomerase [Mycobacteriales bacterium]|nr:peptidylprolyl isomerase [Mycobacteriales bacterium]
MRGRSRRFRRALVGAAVTAVIPVMAGCTTNTSPGAAAVIGDSRISVSALQQQVDDAFADPQIAAALAPGSQFSQALGGDRDGFVRVTLSRMISDRLISAVAAAHHVTVSSKDIADETSTFVQQAGSLQALQQQAAESVGVTAKQLPGLIRLTVLQQRLSDALIAKLPASPGQLKAEYQKDIDQFDQIDIAQIAVSNKGLANHILSLVRKHPASFAALAKKYSEDQQSAANGGEIGLVGRSQVVSLLGAARTKIGTMQLLHTQGEYLVLHLISRHTIPLSQATTQLKSALFAGEATALLQKAISDEAKRQGVHVSPRYGRWDPTTQAVLAVKSTVSLPS